MESSKVLICRSWSNVTRSILPSLPYSSIKASCDGLDNKTSYFSDSIDVRCEVRVSRSYQQIFTLKHKTVFILLGSASR